MTAPCFSKLLQLISKSDFFVAIDFYKLIFIHKLLKITSRNRLVLSFMNSSNMQQKVDISRLF